MKDKTGWAGKYMIQVFKNNEIKETIISNEIHNTGKTMLRDFLNGVVTDGEIKYIAVGNSDATIDVTDTQLGNETFRKAVYSQSNFDFDELLTLSIIENTEANGQIEELGVFAGSTASASANTGIMLSRVLYSKLKTSDESIRITRYDRFDSSIG